MLNEFREWTGWIGEWLIAIYVIAEFYYDKSKDDVKKQKKTRTTKKTTTNPGGSSTIEEAVEVTEPMEDKK